MNEWFEKGHVAIVTGASKGFGLAVAELLAARGLRLIIDARGGEALAAAAERLGATTEVIAEIGDVTDGEHVHRLVTRAEERFGRIDLVVNNASTIGRSPLPHLESLSPNVFERIYQTNVWAPLHLVQHALPSLRRNGGTIVNITSDAALEAYDSWGGYGSSKAALEHWSRILAVELDGSNVSVIVADPGNMDTELHRAAEPGVDLSDLPQADAVAPRLLDAIASPRGVYARVILQQMPSYAETR
ncbi:MAG: SDR family oxidoreductase [Candidatus Baltobacteraceae bacterium]